MCISQITYHSASKQIRLESFWCTTIDSRLSRAVDVHANYFQVLWELWGGTGWVLNWSRVWDVSRSNYWAGKSFQLETIEERVYLHSRKFAVKLLVRSWCTSSRWSLFVPLLMWNIQFRKLKNSKKRKIVGETSLSTVRSSIVSMKV